MGLFRVIQNFFGMNDQRFASESEQSINKELFYKVLDTDHDPLLFFTKENGWIGANKAFFDLVPLDNIEQLRNNHESFRELFDHEDEEVFTEYDKSWLDY
ncbi:MAG: hybrid sensor histidine kinase/response regulator, partial [Sulfuricurvum sp.]